MLTLTCCQDHILTENKWFVWSETSYSGDERRCYRCGTTEQTVKIELLSQWNLEAEFRNVDAFLARAERCDRENTKTLTEDCWTKEATKEYQFLLQISIILPEPKLVCSCHNSIHLSSSVRVEY